MLPKSAFFVPFSRSQKGLKMGLGGDSWGGTNGWTIRASIDPFKGKNQGKNRENLAEPPL